jgi:hypothetical protein
MVHSDKLAETKVATNPVRRGERISMGFWERVLEIIIMVPVCDLDRHLAREPHKLIAPDSGTTMTINY